MIGKRDVGELKLTDPQSVSLCHPAPQKEEEKEEEHNGWRCFRRFLDQVKIWRSELQRDSRWKHLQHDLSSFHRKANMA